MEGEGGVKKWRSMCMGEGGKGGGDGAGVRQICYPNFTLTLPDDGFTSIKYEINGKMCLFFIPTYG